MRRLLHRVASALSLVSRFSVPLGSPPDYAGLPFWLPLIGFLASAIVAGAVAAASLVAGSAGAQAFLGLLALFLAFDLFHFDGLLDSADAFLGFASREKRFEILKDPRTGSFGVFAGLVFLGTLWYCTARAIEAPRIFAAAFLVAPVTGRAAAALIPVLLKPARSGGLGAMIQPYSKRAAFLGLATALILSLLLSWLGATIGTDIKGAGSSLTGLALVATGAGFVFGIAAALAWLLPAYGRGLGGYTGDALGAAICLGTVGHLTCALAVVGAL